MPPPYCPDTVATGNDFIIRHWAINEATDVVTTGRARVTLRYVLVRATNANSTASVSTLQRKNRA